MYLRNEHALYQVRIEPMSARKDFRHSGVVSLKKLAIVPCQGIRVPEKAVAKERLNLIDIIELMCFHFLEMLNGLLIDMELDFTVSPRIEPFVFPDVKVGIKFGHSK